MFQVGLQTEWKNPYKDDRIYYHVRIWRMRHLRIWKLESVKCSQELYRVYECFIRPVMEDRRQDVPYQGHRQNGNNLMFRTGDFKSAYNLDWSHLLNRHLLSFCEKWVHVIPKKKRTYSLADITTPSTLTTCWDHFSPYKYAIQLLLEKNQVCPTFFPDLILYFSLNFTLTWENHLVVSILTDSQRQKLLI